MIVFDCNMKTISNICRAYVDNKPFYSLSEVLDTLLHEIPHVALHHETHGFHFENPQKLQSGINSDEFKKMLYVLSHLAWGADQEWWGRFFLA